MKPFSRACEISHRIFARSTPVAQDKGQLGRPGVESEAFARLAIGAMPSPKTLASIA